MKTFCKTLSLFAASLLMIGSPAHAAGEGWTEDYAKAKTSAAEDSKDMLMDFTGSDWCGWCIKLKDEVFSKDAFKAYAKENLVLVELDFPRKKPQDATIKTQNAELRDAFAVQGYPTIILTDSKGMPYAKTGYRRGGPEAYIKHLEELKAARVSRDKHLADAAKSEGVDKAKHLDEAMKAVGEELALSHYEAHVKEIIELDADNKAGLKSRYTDLIAKRDQEATLRMALMMTREDVDAGLAKLEELINMDGIILELKQQALSIKAGILLNAKKDKAAAKEALQAAIDVLPDSEASKRLKRAMEQVFKD